MSVTIDIDMPEKCMNCRFCIKLNNDDYYRCTVLPIVDYDNHIATYQKVSLCYQSIDSMDKEEGRYIHCPLKECE